MDEIDFIGSEYEEEDNYEEDEEICSFILDPIIEDAEKQLMGDKFTNFDAFLKDLSAHIPHHCEYSKDEDNIVCFCNDCITNQSGCICLKCFFNGNHEGHRCGVTIFPGSFCDCGNSQYIKPEAFCEEHKNCTNFSTDCIDAEIVEKIRNIFKCLLKECDFTSPSDFGVLFQWINKFCKAGNPIIRLFNESFIENVNMDEFFLHLPEIVPWALRQYINLFAIFCYDDLFVDNILPKFVSLIPFYFKSATENYSPGLKVIPKSLYIVADEEQMALLINRNLIDPFKIASEYITTVFNLYQILEFNMEMQMNMNLWFNLSIDLIAPLYKNEKLTEQASKFACEIASKSICIINHHKIYKEKGDKKDDPTFQTASEFYLSLMYEEIATSMCKLKNPLEVIKVIYDELQRTNSYYSEEELNISIFDDRFWITMGIFPYLLVGHIIKVNGPKIIDEFCTQNNINKQLFIKNMSFTLIRLYAAFNQSVLHLFDRNDDITIDTLTRHFDIPEQTIEKFIALQNILNCSDDINDIVDFIAKIFGVYRDDSEYIGPARVMFLKFIIVLSTWNEGFSANNFEWRSLYFGAVLSAEETYPNSIDRIFPERHNVQKVIQKLGDKITITDSCIVHLNDNGMLSPYCPYESTPVFFQAIKYYTDKHKGKFIPYPRVPEELQRKPQNLILSKVINAFVIDILIKGMIDSNKLHPTMIPIVNTIIGEFLSNNEIQQKEKTEICAANLTELVEKVPTDIAEIFNLRIKYGENTYEVIELIKQNKDICKFIIDKLGEEKKVETKNDKDKSKAASIRAKLFSQIKNQQNEFVLDDELDALDDDYETIQEKVCCVCNKPDKLYYLIRVSFTYIFRWLGESREQETKEVDIRFTGCRHLIHEECQNHHICPMDRRLNNFLLPYYNVPDDFIVNREPVPTTYPYISECLANNIKIVEIRYRSFDEINDLALIQELNRNAFYHLRLQKEEDKRGNFDNFRKFINKLVLCAENPANHIIEIAKEMVAEIEDNKAKLRFLRSVLACDIVLFNKKHVVNYETVNAIFGTNFTKDDEPKPLEFKMPEQYYKLYAPPGFNPEWSANKNQILYDVMTGKYITDGLPPIQNIFLFPSPNIYILLNGNLASMVIVDINMDVYTQEIRYPVYTCEDSMTTNFGLSSEVQLFLNKDITRKLLEQLLADSFNWSI